MQFFKEDADELKFYLSFKPTSDEIGVQLDQFLAGAYSAYPLANIIMEDDRAPLANAIDPVVFRDSFQAIFDAFIDAGTLESYLIVFRKIFGDDVDVEFTVPAPGKLNVDIHASGLEIVDFIARRISNNEYVFDEVVTQGGDTIAFSAFKGLESEYQVRTMLFEMVPGGIFTNITLTLG